MNKIIPITAGLILVLFAPISELFKSKPFNIHTSNKLCPSNLYYVDDINRHRSSNKLIPNHIYQTGEGRCVTWSLWSAMRTWSKLENYSYSYYDSERRDAFLKKPRPQFPHLSTLLRCIVSPTIKADLFRYLMLWENGGIYSDWDDTINSPKIPITEEDEGLFGISRHNHLTQHFLAVRPKHPLMYFTLKWAISNIIRSYDIGTINPVTTVGPQAFWQGFLYFMNERKQTKFMGRKKFKLKEGIYSGFNNATVRIYGHERSMNGMLRVKQVNHKKNYWKMNISHFSGIRTPYNRSCFHELAVDLF